MISAFRADGTYSQDDSMGTKNYDRGENRLGAKPEKRTDVHSRYVRPYWWMDGAFKTRCSLNENHAPQVQ
jgi:hypothetical protein